MKKATILAATFLVVFGMTIGIVVGLSNDAKAIGLCSFECGVRTVWSHTTGSLCPGSCPSSVIYYVYRRATCVGGPLNCQYFNNFIGCWDGQVKLICAAWH